MTITENFKSAVVLNGFCKTVFHNETVINNRTCRNVCKVSKVYDNVYFLCVMIEASLRHATRDRHLTAFEARTYTATGTSPLTFVTLTGRFTQARTDTATKSLRGFGCSLCGRKSIYSHNNSP